MNQDLAGQPSNQQRPNPKKFLDAYVAVSDLQEERDPTQFQRIANGRPGMTLADNARNYT